MNRLIKILTICVCLIATAFVARAQDTTKLVVPPGKDATTVANDRIRQLAAAINKDRKDLEECKAALDHERRNAVSILNQELVKIEKPKNELVNSYPLIIHDIELTSTDRAKQTVHIAYGETLYLSKLYYVWPRIKYTGYAEKRIKLLVKLIDPSGKILDYNPETGATYDDTIQCRPGDNVVEIGVGWGDNGQLTYKTTGKWRIEFWYGDKCVGSKMFMIN